MIKDLKRHKSFLTGSQNARWTLYKLVKDQPAGLTPYQSCCDSTWVPSARTAAALFLEALTFGHCWEGQGNSSRLTRSAEDRATNFRPRATTPGCLNDWSIIPLPATHLKFLPLRPGWTSRSMEGKWHKSLRKYNCHGVWNCCECNVLMLLDGCCPTIILVRVQNLIREVCLNS